ncbi:hypothetical protein ACROYT_G031558 [Oculina patagonica]
MAEDLQLEIQSNIYAADWSSLERIAEFFKVEIEGKSKLFVAKFIVQQLEEGIGKLKEAEVVPYLEDVKKLLTEKPSGIKDEGKSGKFVPSVSKPPSVAKEDSVQKLLATSALRRQFKISGQIGEPEQKDKISFSSLARQIQTGLAQGYAEDEIVDGVIRSITPGMVLRSYLETYKDLTLERLKKILRSHYGAKNTSELYQTLASLCQSSKESPQVFLMNALDLRQQILFACSEGDDDTSLQYDSGHIQCLFLRTVETGLQDESIRAKIRPFLKDPNVSDEVLMQQMSMATSAEKERDKKLRNNSKTKPPALSVSTVSDDSSKGKEENKKSTPQNDLLAAISAIKSEVEALKSEGAVKQESTASARRETVVNPPKSHQCNNCCKTGVKQGQLKRCSQCRSVWYCSTECQKGHWSDHKVLCQAISHLSEASTRKSKDFVDPACVSHLTPSEHAKVIGLVGKKCMVKCLLNDCECDLLWDTGAQVSIISVELLQQHLGQVAIRQLSELLDTNLNLTAVNGTKVPYIGWVEVRVKLTSLSSDSSQEELLVPFLVTSEKLDCPILGYNVIEELVSQDQNPKPIIYNSFPGKDKTKLDALVHFIQSSSSDAICKTD